jgi:hypothetical protein
MRTFQFFSFFSLLIIKYQAFQMLLLHFVLHLGRASVNGQGRRRRNSKLSSLKKEIPTLNKKRVKMLTCCLLPRLVITVKFIVPCPLTGWASESSSFSSTRFLRTVGGRTADSQRARAVFLSTFRDSADVSVTIFANSLANSASASSEGPRCSWRLLLADNMTSWSGEGGRSSI